MPLKRKVKSLKELCFQSIIDDMDSYWCKDYTENFPEGGKLMHVVGPFDDLPAGIKHELVMFLGVKSKLKRAHLELLFDESTTKIDFSTRASSVLLRDGLLDLISLRCKNLTTLNMDWCRKVTPKMLLEAFPNFTQLKALKLDGTKCTDRVLHVIGHYCHKLVELHVSHCNDVTDQGLKKLLLDTSGSVQCPSLTKLYVEATRTTEESVKLALRNLPKLQVMENEFLLEALTNLHEQEYGRYNGKADTSKQYKLTRLGPQSNVETESSDYSHELSRQLSIAVAYCPFVVEVTLFAFANDECLVTLSLLEQIKSLVLLQCFEHVTFDNGILPFLQIRGQQMHTLRLEVSEIDTKVVGFFCPNVVKLELEFLNNFVSDATPVKFTKHSKLFSRLLWLSVACENISMDNFSLRLLLSHCQNITSLCLKNVNDMTDKTMAEIYTSNPMNKLETLCLKQCDSITVDSVWPLLRRYNEMKVLHLVSCQKTTRQDAERIGKHIRKHKDPLDFKWS